MSTRKRAKIWGHLVGLAVAALGGVSLWRDWTGDTAGVVLVVAGALIALGWYTALDRLDTLEVGGLVLFDFRDEDGEGCE